MTPAPCRETLRIPASHPALPGHFPGRPVVPGVVLLDRVAAALERCSGQRIAAIRQAKFLRPLLPDEEAELIIDGDGSGLRFRIVHAGVTIATGLLEGSA